MSDKRKKLEGTEQKVVAAVKKYLDSEKLNPMEEQMNAYDYTASTPGQRV